MNLTQQNELMIKQMLEGWELVGIETRNKYAIMDNQGHKIGFAAEQSKGIIGWLLRQYLGHWRRFEVHFFNEDKTEFMKAVHPFRWFFQRFEVYDAQGQLQGALQQRFAILTKKFDLEDANGQVVMEVSSPFWKIWTFPFQTGGRQRAKIEKKWGGALTEIFTDKDTFRISFDDESLDQATRLTLLASAIFVDLQYFENKAN